MNNLFLTLTLTITTASNSYSKLTLSPIITLSLKQSLEPQTGFMGLRKCHPHFTFTKDSYTRSLRSCSGAQGGIQDTGVESQTEIHTAELDLAQAF